MTLKITLLHGQGPFYLLVTNTLKYYKVLNFILVSCTDSHGLVVMRVAIGTEGSRFKPLVRQHFFPIFCHYKVNNKCQNYLINFMLYSSHEMVSLFQKPSFLHQLTPQYDERFFIELQEKYKFRT